MSARRPNVRPMAGWWRKNPYFVEYMVHESTAFLVLAYALVLIATLAALARGEAAWNAWVAWQRTAPALALHVVLLAGFAYHAWTWVHIMPRTLPPIVIRGRRVGGAAITAAGLAAMVASSAVVLLLAWRIFR
jgi:fumarate reductase subunit C